MTRRPRAKSSDFVWTAGQTVFSSKRAHTGRLVRAVGPPRDSDLLIADRSRPGPARGWPGRAQLMPVPSGPALAGPGGPLPDRRSTDRGGRLGTEDSDRPARLPARPGPELPPALERAGPGSGDSAWRVRRALGCGWGGLPVMRAGGGSISFICDNTLSESSRPPRTWARRAPKTGRRARPGPAGWRPGSVGV
jgi:hypothetical protein